MSESEMRIYAFIRKGLKMKNAAEGGEEKYEIK